MVSRGFIVASAQGEAMHDRLEDGSTMQSAERFGSASHTHLRTCSAALWKPAVPATALIHEAYEEEDPRRQLRARGATWEAGLRRWRVPLSLLKELHLENRLDTPSGPS